MYYLHEVGVNRHYAQGRQVPITWQRGSARCHWKVQQDAMPWFNLHFTVIDVRLGYTTAEMTNTRKVEQNLIQRKCTLPWWMG